MIFLLLAGVAQNHGATNPAVAILISRALIGPTAANPTVTNTGKLALACNAARIVIGPHSGLNQDRREQPLSNEGGQIAAAPEHLS